MLTRAPHSIDFFGDWESLLYKSSMKDICMKGVVSSLGRDRSLAGARLCGCVALLLSFSCSICSRRFRNEFEPNENNGVVEITMPAAPPGLTFTICTTDTVERLWRATKVPAKVSVPYDKPVRIRASAPGYHSFTKDISVSRLKRRISVDIMLERSRLLFGVAYPEIPRQTGLVPLDVPIVGVPAQPVFQIVTYSSVARPPTAPEFVVDDQRKVWLTSFGTKAYWQVGEISLERFARLKSLCGPAAETPFVPEPLLGSDLRIVVEASCNSEVLASEMNERGRRKNAAAAEILAWLDAVEFESRGSLWRR
jgi:hypothetical protein